MNPVSAIVLYAVIWFLTALVLLPIGLRTQGDEGEVVPGTPRSAPADFRVRRLLLMATIWATLVWGIVAAAILWSGITVRDLDFFGRMSPPG